MPQPPFGRRELAWIVLDLDVAYVRDAILPDVLLRHLESGGVLDYQVEVVTRSYPPALVYQSDPNGPSIIAKADASIGLLDLRMAPFPDGGGRTGRGGGRGPGITRAVRDV